MNEYQAEFDELVAKIREAERAKILAAIGVGEGVQSARGRAGRKPGRQPRAASSRAVTTRPKGAKRTPSDIESLTRDLLGYVRKNSGQRIEQIATALGVATGDLALPAKKLIAEKKLKTQGQKRGTTYYTK